jgi:nicotinic acid mononucleotide adenylyltransferase
MDESITKGESISTEDVKIEMPKMVFSFQGAFAPPTYGHYVAMRIFANKMLIHYPNHEIVMLFMPNGAGGSKPHISYTRESRMTVLDAFCEKLNSEYLSNGNITFGASDIEYWLCTAVDETYKYTPQQEGIGKIKDKKYKIYNAASPPAVVDLGMNDENPYNVTKDSVLKTITQDKYGYVIDGVNTGTFRTLPVLQSMFPGYKIVLGMGKDNLLQIIYWKMIDTYVNTVDAIYAVDRELTPEDASMAGEPFNLNSRTNGDTTIIFQRQLPWSMSDTDLKLRFGDNVTTDIIDGKKTISSNNVSVALPPLYQLVNIPPSTSSTLMRKFIQAYLYFVQDDAAKTEIKEKIKKLIFGLSGIEQDKQDTLTNAVINEYNKVGVKEKVFKVEMKEEILTNANTEYGNIKFDIKGGRTKKRRHTKKVKSIKRKMTKRRKLKTKKRY